MKLKSDLADNCDCLPLCGSVDYNAEISQSDWNWRKYLGGIDKYGMISYNLDIDFDK